MGVQNPSRLSSMVKKKSKKSTVPIWYAIVGLIVVSYNQATQFLATWGVSEAWQVNFVLLAVMIGSAYYFTPYLDAIVRGLK